MVIETRLFGKIEIEDAKIIFFPDGIIGFPNMKRFTLISNEEKDSKIYWFQSLDDGAFAMPVIDPLMIKSDYNPVVEDELLKPIGGLDGDSISVFVTITVPDEIEKMTVNLKAPFIINTETTKGLQLILEDADLSIRYPIYDLLKEEKAGE